MKKLVELRYAKNVTKTEVAKHLGITRQAYSNYEMDLRKPNMDILMKLADYFGVSVDDIIDYSSKNSNVVYLAPPEYTGLLKEVYDVFSQLPESRQKLFIKWMKEDLNFLENEKRP